MKNVVDGVALGLSMLRNVVAVVRDLLLIVILAFVLVVGGKAIQGFADQYGDKGSACAINPDAPECAGKK
jgi:hypothetical protein